MSPVPDPADRRQLGKTGLLVSPLCLGCAPLGNMGTTFGYGVPEERALATLRATFASPINFLDTSANYGNGESERRVGIALRELGGVPAGFVVDTKADREVGSNRFDGDQARHSVEESLQRLGLSRLQLCYLHDPEYSAWEQVTGKGGAVDALVRLRDEGVIEHLGLAGGPIDVLNRYLDLGVFEALISHNRYTLLEREAGPLFVRARAEGLGVVNAAPYGSGLLAKGPIAYPRYMYREASPEFLERARRMDAACARHGVSLAAAALQFSLRDPNVDSTIVGMTHPERVQQTVDLARTPIPDGLWPELLAI
jgi:D-threo-aldose 1-dehydrogenase